MLEVEALLFDLDGTLIDSKEDLAQSVRWLQRRYGVAESSLNEVATFIGNGVIQLIDQALRHPRADTLKRAVPEYKAYYRIHCMDTTEFYGGVLETLHHFRHKKLGVVTNKPARVTRRILESFGIANLFGCVLGGDSLRRKKPDPLPVLSALHALRTAPLRAVMVGDGPNDVLAGQAAGTKTCLVRSNITSAEELARLHPDVTISSFGALRHFFR